MAKLSPIFVAFVVACVTVSVSCSQVDYAAEFSNNLVARFLRHFNGRAARNTATSADEPGMGEISIPILPQFDDPLVLEDNAFAITQAEEGRIYGTGSSWDSQVKGLARLLDWLTISPTPDYDYLFSYVVDIPRVSIDGKHDVSVTLQESSANIVSNGDYSVSASKIKIGLDLTVKILLQNGLEVTSASVDFDFSQLAISTTSTTNSGEKVNWNQLCRRINLGFSVLFKTVIKPALDDMVLNAAKSALEGCKFTDLITGNLDCIRGGEAEPALFTRLRV